MSLATITHDGAEISDAIVSFDPNTLQRYPVKKADVLDQFRELRNHEAVRIVMLGLKYALGGLRSREVIS